jgi:alpha-glucosidase
VQDPRELREPGLGLGRDPVRTPMPWDAWRRECRLQHGLALAAAQCRLAERNVAAMAEDPASMLTLYRDLLALGARIRRWRSVISAAGLRGRCARL